MTVKELIKKAVTELKAVPIEDPEISAEFLLRFVLDQSRAEFYANLDRKVTENEAAEFKVLIERRKKHEPVYQITGQIEFWGLDFFVNGDVLVPRPETEFLVKEVIEAVKKNRNHVSSGLRVLDVGTGAGTIIIALASEMRGGVFFASDISGEALVIAKKNAKTNNLEKKIVFKEGGLFEPWKNEKFDIITANLPYIPHEDLPGLTVEIYHYEPRVALDGGDGGLKIYEEFLRELPKHLKSGGYAFCEIGKGQGDRFKVMVEKYLPQRSCMVLKDLAGFDRIGIIGNKDKEAK